MPQGCPLWISLALRSRAGQILSLVCAILMSYSFCALNQGHRASTKIGAENLFKLCQTSGTVCPESWASVEGPLFSLSSSEEHLGPSQSSDDQQGRKHQEINTSQMENQLHRCTQSRQTTPSTSLVTFSTCGQEAVRVRSMRELTGPSGAPQVSSPVGTLCCPSSPCLGPGLGD